MATIQQFNEICLRNPIDAIGYAKASQEPMLLGAAAKLLDGAWRVSGNLILAPVLGPTDNNDLLLPTIQSFNLVLRCQGEDAALSFAARSGSGELEWAAQMLRAGKWSLDNTGNSKTPRIQRPVRTKDPETARAWKNQRAANLAKRRDENRKRAKGGTGKKSKKN